MTSAMFDWYVPKICRNLDEFEAGEILTYIRENNSIAVKTLITEDLIGKLVKLLTQNFSTRWQSKECQLICDFFSTPSRGAVKEYHRTSARFLITKFLGLNMYY